MTRRELESRVVEAATPIYGACEARQIARIVLEELATVSWSSYILNPNEECVINNLDGVLCDIKRGRPIQYITGRVEFCGIELAISEGALIPRPESEELIEWIVQEQPEALRVVDLCSGSGALAIALACKLPKAQVWAVELSHEAIAHGNTHDSYS